MRKPTLKVALTSKERENKKSSKAKKRKREEEKTDDSNNQEENYYRCVHPDCSCVFILEKNLIRHLETGYHFYGSSDLIHTSGVKLNKRKTESWSPPTERIDEIRVNDAIIMTVNGTEVMAGANIEMLHRSENNRDNGIEAKVHDVQAGVYSYGYAVRKSGKPRKRSKAQLQFIHSWLTSSPKILPEVACQMMKVCGTAAGEARHPESSFMKATSSDTRKFKYIEQLSRFQLKSYASKQPSKILEMISSASDIAIAGEDDENEDEDD